MYACRTCGNGGVCAHCSLGCHAEHDLVELFHRRNFRCDCGTPSLARLQPAHEVSPCSLRSPGLAPPNDNRYTHNFEGAFCYCDKGKTYDPELEEEARFLFPLDALLPDAGVALADDEWNGRGNLQTMFQCVACEEWYHENCLSLARAQGQLVDQDDFEELICSACVLKHPILQSYLGADGSGFATVVPRDVCQDSNAVAHARTVPQLPREQAADGTKGATTATADLVEQPTLDVIVIGLLNPPEAHSQAGAAALTTSHEAVPPPTAPRTDLWQESPLSNSTSRPAPTSSQQIVPPTPLPTQGKSTCQRPKGTIDFARLRSLQDASTTEDTPAEQRAPRVDLYLGPEYRSRICRCADVR